MENTNQGMMRRTGPAAAATAVGGGGAGALPVEGGVLELEGDLVVCIVRVREAFARNPEALNFEARGWALADALAGLGSAAGHASRHDLMDAVNRAVDVLLLDPVDWDSPVWKAVHGLVEANAALGRAFAEERRKRKESGRTGAPHSESADHDGKACGPEAPRSQRADHNEGGAA